MKGFDVWFKRIKKISVPPFADRKLEYHLSLEHTTIYKKKKKNSITI